MIFVFTLFNFLSLFWPFFGLLVLGSYFWPFTEVMRKIRREVTRKVWELLKTTNYADNTNKKRPTKTEGKKSYVFLLCFPLEKECFG